MLIVTDQTGRTHSFSKIPKRIITVVPSQTELLFDLGLDEEVIGITKFCVHPESWFHSKTRIGGTKNLNIEKIKSLQPDFILANKEENDEHQVKSLSAEFPVWITDIKTFDDALQMINDVSVITGKQLQGKQIIDQIRTGFFHLEEGVKQLFSAAYFIWDKPLMTVGGDTFISDIMARAGFQNVFAGKNRYPEILTDDLNHANPDVIFLSSEPYPFKEIHIEKFKNICPGTIVLTVDGEMFSWYGSRLINSPFYLNDISTKINSAL